MAGDGAGVMNGTERGNGGRGIGVTEGMELGDRWDRAGGNGGHGVSVTRAGAGERRGRSGGTEGLEREESRAQADGVLAAGVVVVAVGKGQWKVCSEHIQNVSSAPVLHTGTGQGKKSGCSHSPDNRSLGRKKETLSTSGVWVVPERCRPPFSGQQPPEAALLLQRDRGAGRGACVRRCGRRGTGALV